MSETFFISLTWCIAFVIVVFLISILLYNYFVKDNIRCYGKRFCKEFPKEAIEILKQNNFLKDDNSQKE